MGVVLDIKLDIFNSLKRSNLKIPCTYFYNWEKQKKKLRKNWNFYSIPIFDKIDFVLLM